MREHPSRGRDDSYKDLNPNGFWECNYSVQGIQYNYPDRFVLRDYLKEEEGKETYIKIVSQGLLGSDTRYINKVVYVIRHPRNVAKSQERLKRGFDIMLPNGERQGLMDELVIHTPKMYMDVTAAAARFFMENPQIPVHFLMYDDLVENPEKHVRELCEFLGEDADEGWGRCEGIVNPKLRRSYPEDIESVLWEESEEIYKRFGEKDFVGVLDYVSDPDLNMHTDGVDFLCLRSGGVGTAGVCQQCISDRGMRENLKQGAAMPGRQIDWAKEPCLWECAYDPARKKDEYVDVHDSIENNHWK